MGTETLPIIWQCLLSLFFRSLPSTAGQAYGHRLILASSLAKELRLRESLLARAHQLQEIFMAELSKGVQGYEKVRLAQLINLFSVIEKSGLATPLAIISAAKAAGDEWPILQRIEEAASVTHNPFSQFHSSSSSSS